MVAPVSDVNRNAQGVHDDAPPVLNVLGEHGAGQDEVEPLIPA